jgi:hypothetical protein
VTREDLLSAALKLPLDERTALADSLLRSLDELPEPERKKLWLDVADRRLQEMREEKAREIPADEVFARGRAISLTQKEEQRRSFAYGNASIENDRVTKEMVAREAEALKANAIKK